MPSEPPRALARFRDLGVRCVDDHRAGELVAKSSALRVDERQYHLDKLEDRTTEDQQEHEATARSAESGARTGAAQGSGSVLGVYGEAAGQLTERIRVRGGLRLDSFSGGGPLAVAPRAASGAVGVCVPACPGAVAAGSGCAGGRQRPHRAGLGSRGAAFAQLPILS